MIRLARTAGKKVLVDPKGDDFSKYAGATIVTPNRNEFLLAQAGLNTGYQINRTLEVFVDVTYGLRVRKSLMHGVYGTAGLWILFD